MARAGIAYRSANMAEIKRHVGRLAYLRTADKVLVALSYEFGPDRRMPPRATIQSMLDDYRARTGKRREYA